MIKIPAVQLDGRKGKLASTADRAYPLDEPGMPRLELASAEGLLEIVAFLKVEESVRYRPGGGITLCNIYAYDFCTLAGAYLPRVWWSPGALASIRQTGDTPPAMYGKTIFEMNANALFDWLAGVGAEFGWKRVADAAALQGYAAKGFATAICAKRIDLTRSGHITVVVPETETVKATKESPVQSQAGTVNRAIFTDAWWVRRRAEFRSVGFFWNDPRSTADTEPPLIEPKDLPELRRGAVGPFVDLLQERLNLHGANPKLSVDGTKPGGGFGPKTGAALVAFKNARNLEGEFTDALTWEALLA